MNLSKARENCDRTVADIARIMQVSEGTVYNWERGKRITLNLDDMPKLWAAYGIEPDMNEARESVSSKNPDVFTLIKEAEDKVRWDREWVRFSLVLPRDTIPLIEQANQFLRDTGVKLHENSALMLGILLKWAIVDMLSGAGWMNEDDAA